MTATTIAAIYARISDDKRRGTEDEGKSVDAQIRECKEYVKRKGWELGKVYRDDHRPATKEAPRPAFEEMLRETPPVVVYWQQTRLERGNEHTRDLDRFLALGLEGYGVDGTRVTMESASAELMTRFGSLIAGYEGKLRKERQKLRYRSDAKEGKWHYARPVFGNDRVTGTLIEDEAAAIRTSAAELVAGTTTFYKISKAWNEAGFRTPQSKGAGGRLWEPGTVRKFFTAPRLIGKRVYNGETHEMQGWEPVLDEDTFNAIQDMIEANKTGKRGVQGNRNMPHLLTSIATCGAVVDEEGTVCGQGLNVGYRGGKNNTRHYRCTTPGHVSRVALPLEKWIVEKFLYLLLHDGAERIVHPQGAATSHKLRVERATLIKTFDAWMKEAIEIDLSPKTIKAKGEAHAKRLAEIDARLLESLRESSFAMLVTEIPDAPELLWERWESVPMDKKREVLKSLFKSIVVLPGGQGARFKPEFVKLTATPLMMQLVDLNSEAEDMGEEMARALMGTP